MDLTNRIENYWSKRSEDFSNIRIAELKSEKRRYWIDIICSKLPKEKNLKVLDIGTGTGFFAVIMASLGHKVVGIDLSSSMIENSKKTSKLLGYEIDFKVMNAEELDFKDETFDIVISRNLTWTLQDVKKAYSDWYRVLKKGGMLLNFDADYGPVSFSKQVEELDSNHAHAKIDKEFTKECDDIKELLEVSKKVRPNWDIDILNNIGFIDCRVDNSVSERVYKDKDELYNPTEMFGIYAKK